MWSQKQATNFEDSAQSTAATLNVWALKKSRQTVF
jgi:hypothetical protein